MISIKQIRHAEKTLHGKILRTPLVYSPTLSRMFDCELFLKLENLQKTGSFKIRGATYKLIKNKNNIPSGGVVAASAGNHAQGVALAAREAHIPATIVMPEWVSITKQEATRNYGGEVIIKGATVNASIEKAHALAKEGRLFIHPFDDPDIISGQGTIALEIFEDLNDVDMIVAPVGGGGLISGLSVAARHIRPETKIIGVQSALCPSAHESLKKGDITRVTSRQSIADGITVKQIGEETFAIIKKSVDDIVLVEEEQIASAILMLLERKKILSEGAGAVPLAALLSGKIAVEKGSKVVLVVSGGNVDSLLLGRIISQGLLKHGRIMRFGAKLDDLPGSMAKLLSLIAAQKANVLHIYHSRNVKDMPVYKTCVELEIETRGHSHVEEIAGELKQAGYDVILK